MECEDVWTGERARRCGKRLKSMKSTGKVERMERSFVLVGARRETYGWIEDDLRSLSPRSEGPVG